MSEQRVTLTLPELRARRGVKWTYHPTDTLAAWVADMDFRCPEAIHRALKRIVDESDFGYAYRGGQPLGPAVARAFAARVQERFGWSVDPARVLTCTDLVQGVFDTVLAYSSPEDQVIVQGPTYDPFREGIEDTGRVMVVNHMKFADNTWTLDVEGLRTASAASPLLLLCHPHNPTGRAFTRAELEEVARIAVENDLTVVSDEIWADFMFDDAQHLPFAMLSEEIAARTVTLYSAGKSFSLAGLRCAVIHFGSDELQRRFFDRFPPRMLGGVNVMGAEATITAWSEGAEWFGQVMEILHANRDAVASFVADHADALSGAYPESTYLYWLDCSRLDLGATTPAQFFQSAGVIVSPGADFGPDYGNFIRLNFATSPEILKRILDRMSHALDGRVRELAVV